MVCAFLHRSPALKSCSASGGSMARARGRVEASSGLGGRPGVSRTGYAGMRRKGWVNLQESGTRRGDTGTVVTSHGAPFTAAGSLLVCF